MSMQRTNLDKAVAVVHLCLSGRLSGYRCGRGDQGTLVGGGKNTGAWDSRRGGDAGILVMKKA